MALRWWYCPRYSAHVYHETGVAKLCPDCALKRHDTTGITRAFVTLQPVGLPDAVMDAAWAIGGYQAIKALVAERLSRG